MHADAINKLAGKLRDKGRFVRFSSDGHRKAMKGSIVVGSLTGNEGPIASWRPSEESIINDMQELLRSEM